MFDLFIFIFSSSSVSLNTKGCLFEGSGYEHCKSLGLIQYGRDMYFKGFFGTSGLSENTFIFGLVKFALGVYLLGLGDSSDVDF